MIRSKPTTYRSHRMRSRLEARWAAFFDLIGWRWEYEPLDLAGWMPDFLIHGERPLLVEVKPAKALEELVAQRPKLERATVGLDYDLLIVGLTPVMVLSDYGDGAVCAGDHCQGPAVKECGPDALWDDDGGPWWVDCPDHGIAVSHTLHGWIHDPCGCRLESWHKPVSADRLHSLWGEAGSRVQWMRR